MTMMNNVIIFLRHAQTSVNLSKPARNWVLSEEGMRKMKSIAKDVIFDNIDIVYSSTEKKAIQTAFFISEIKGKKIITKKSFDELKRKKPLENKMLYEDAVAKVFKNPSQAVLEWETAEEALIRFSREVEKIDKENKDKIILIVSHGLVLSLYFANLLKIPKEEIFGRWKRLEFCAWGIVENQQVIKDIIEKNQK